MNRAELDKLAAEHVSHKLLQKEPGLFDTKWFDYRGLHPVQATALFMTAYSDAYKEACKYRIDIEEGEKMTGLKRVSLFDQAKSTLTGIWKARQFCDEHGIKYPFYCHNAMDIACDNGWDYLPRPSQLYGQEMPSRTLEAWDRRISESPILADSAIYKASNFRGLRDQVMYQHWLIKQIRLRFNPEFLTRRLLDSDHLVESFLVQDNDLELLNKARSVDCFDH